MSVTMLKTKVQLEETMRYTMEWALNNVYEDLRRKLLDIIEEKVYGYSAYYSTEANFGREHSFSDMDTWEVDTYKYGDLGARIEYVPENILYEYEPLYGQSKYGYSYGGYAHGNAYDVISGKAFFDLMNGGTTGDFAGYPSITREPFWKDFVDYYNANFDSMFRAECAKLGMDLQGGAGTVVEFYARQNIVNYSNASDFVPY